mgnify:CR=1 FL=1
MVANLVETRSNLSLTQQGVEEFNLLNSKISHSLLILFLLILIILFAVRGKDQTLKSDMILKKNPKTPISWNGICSFIELITEKSMFKPIKRQYLGHLRTRM